MAGEDMIQQVLGRICAACDGPPWRDGAHLAIAAALAKVPDGDAKTVLIDLVGMVAVLDRRISNLNLAAEPFLGEMDDGFREMLDEQEKAVAQSGVLLRKAEAALRLGEVLSASVQMNSRASIAPEDSLLGDVRNAVAKVRAST